MNLTSIVRFVGFVILSIVVLWLIFVVFQLFLIWAITTFFSIVSHGWKWWHFAIILFGLGLFSVLWDWFKTISAGLMAIICMLSPNKKFAFYFNTVVIIIVGIWGIISIWTGDDLNGIATIASILFSLMLLGLMYALVWGGLFTWANSQK